MDNTPGQRRGDRTPGSYAGWRSRQVSTHVGESPIRGVVSHQWDHPRRHGLVGLGSACWGEPGVLRWLSAWLDVGR